MNAQVDMKDVRSLILIEDAHEAAKKLARSLRLDAQVQTMVGTWEEGGQLTGWTKVHKSRGCDTLVELFISDMDGETREFDRYARKFEEVMAAKDRRIAELEAQLADSATVAA